MRQIRRTETLDAIGIGCQPMRRNSLGHDPRIGAAGHRHVAHRVGDAELLFEGARQRSCAGATGQHQRAVDVEEKESG